MVTEERPALVGNIQESLFLSGLSRKLSGPQLRLATASYFIKKRQLDSAELCLDLAIKEVLNASDKDTGLLKRMLVEKALIAQTRKDFNRAIRYLDQAEALPALAGEQTFEAGLIHSAQGAVAFAQNDYRRAREMYEEAGRLFGSVDDGGDMRARAYWLAGFAAYREFDFEKSLELYQQARGGNDSLTEVQVRLGIIDALTVLNRSEEAIAACKSLEADIMKFSLRRSVQQNVLAALREKEANNWLSVGRTQRAVKIYRKLSEGASMAVRTKIFATLSVIEFIRGRSERSRLYEEEVQSLIAGMDHGISDVVLSLSRLNLMRGRVDLAERQLFDATVELPKTARGYRDTLAYKLMDVSISQTKGEFASAVDKAEELLDFLEGSMPFSTSHAAVLANLASFAQLNGDLERADDLYTQVLSIGEQLNAPGTILRALSGLGQVALEKIGPDTALSYFRKARGIAESMEQMISVHSLMISEVMAEIRMRGDPDEADAERLSDLLEQGFKFESTPLDLQAVFGLAQVWSEIGDLDRAASYYSGAADDAKRVGMTLAELIAKGLLAITMHNNGDAASAEEILSDVLTRMTSLGMQIPAKDMFEERYHDVTGFWF